MPRRGVDSLSLGIMRPEDALLVSCARTSIGPELADRVRSLVKGPIDWNYLVLSSNRHGLTPLLYRQLSAASPPGVPEQVLDRLRAEYRSNARRNLAMTAELIRLLALFEEHGIAVVPLKGPLLASSVYGDVALRQFIDLDILVRKRDVSRASALLVSRGYKPQFRLNEAAAAALLEARCEHGFTRDDAAIIVDLHWAITPLHFSFSPSPERLWRRLRPVSFAGREVRALSPEDSLITACVHGTKHGWAQLNFACDLAEIIRAHPAMDWARITEEAEHGRRMVFLGLYLADMLLGAELPEGIRRAACAEPRVRTLAERVLKVLFGASGPRRWLPEADLVYLGAMDCLTDRGRYWFEQIVSPTPLEWALLPLPQAMSPLYYFMRPLRLVGKHALGPVIRAWNGNDKGRRSGSE